MLTNSENQPITYLDYAGIYPPEPGLFETWRDLAGRCFANPHSTTRFSADCKALLHNAEREVLEALAIPVEEADVIWTSGGTEALNLAIQGILLASSPPASCRVDATAHAAMSAAARHFCAESAIPLQPLGVDRRGRIRIDGEGSAGAEEKETEGRRLRTTITDDRFHSHPPHAPVTPVSSKTGALLAINHVNNETGVVQDLATIRQNFPADILLVDALQSAGKLPIPWSAAGIDLLAIGGRKIGGPASIGALIVRKGIHLRPLMVGGGQQQGLRPGTVDVPAAVLFARTLARRIEQAERNWVRLSELRETLLAGLKQIEEIDPATISPLAASPYITCVAFPGYEGAILMRLLAEQGIVVGSGSACSSESGGPSHVLTAMGYNDAQARSALRVSFGAGSSQQDVDHFLTALAAVPSNY